MNISKWNVVSASLCNVPEENETDKETAEEEETVDGHESVANDHMFGGHNKLKKKKLAFLNTEERNSFPKKLDLLM